ncbi:hypothetical protein M011DRAFT_206802 [Sporormia fimetaria CBS 119925]|uniref:Uncharacterized protein n=1 Tax=Sporormia fimetaria CBS 119925 TaxID=1340428 RepID=A0A6A6V234_9PLEO|nr:hypothetical protein M011DRAFT_206802 [Sporormia fimetaria CBS 119925]
MPGHPEKSEATTDKMPGGTGRNNQPPFLRLPRELRDEIYKHALTAPHGLVMIPDFKATGPQKQILIRCVPRAPPVKGRRCSVHFRQNFADRWALREVNNLRFVSRQLHEETSGLEYKYNSVLVIVEPGVGPAENFLSCVRIPYVQKHIHWARNITLWTAGHFAEGFRDKQFLDNGRSLLGLANFCKRHPHIRVEYICPIFFWGRTDTDLGDLMCLWLRVRPLLACVAHRPHMSNYQQTYATMDTASVGGMLVSQWHQRMAIPSLRFFPNETDMVSFDEKWRRFLLKQTDIAHPEMKEHVKSWFKDGF